MVGVTAWKNSLRSCSSLPLAMAESYTSRSESEDVRRNSVVVLVPHRQQLPLRRPPQRGQESPAFHALTGCLTVRLRGQRSGTLRAFGLPGSSEVTASNSCLHFAHAMVRVATANPTSGPPETTASYPHASHRN